MNLSLYEFLGRAAGSKLGEIVYKYALEHNWEIFNKTLNHKGWKGNVRVYRKDDLVKFFENFLFFQQFTNVNVMLPTPTLKDIIDYWKKYKYIEHGRIAYKQKNK